MSGPAELTRDLATGSQSRVLVRVRGIVQGVGYRPFVHGLATELGVSGHVGNDEDGVFVEAEGGTAQLDTLVRALTEHAPPLAVVDDVRVTSLPPTGAHGFHIVDSKRAGRPTTLVSADVATCPDCLRELFDPADRRYRHPFINCTNCGPRFTIVRDLPYDRAATTMAGFPMCPGCRREYDDPSNRRFHAQPVCCPVCGPRLRLVDAGGVPIPGDPIAAAVALIDSGQVVAVKGLGGYHLAVDAADETAVARLRGRKHREDKPFAVMAAGLADLESLVELDAAGATLLTGRRCPIVLAPRRAEAGLAPSVAPGNRSVGVLLPYTPTHHLLARDLGRPFVLTSGNVSDEPIASVDDEAQERLAAIADAFLVHDRPIHIRADDSVVRIVSGVPLPLRRSRGYAPEPVRLPVRASRHLLACGAELKSTFCLVRDDTAFVSHHIGDLENYETLRSFTSGIDHLAKLFEVQPEVVAYDMHPDYLSTAHAQRLADAGLEPVGVQHHHAHIASCLADNAEPGPVLGLALDGTGFGPDGTLWGGEVLRADLLGYERLGHLRPVPLPGGTAAIRAPWRTASAYLDLVFGAGLPAGLAVRDRNADQWGDVLKIARAGVSSPLTSSAGRLFDAVSALCGVRDRVNYEGQAAIELEQRVDLDETGLYPCAVEDAQNLVLQGPDLVAAAADDLLTGTEVGVVAARFHNGLVRALAEATLLARERTGLSAVALSGGVFQNVVLLERLTRRLEEAGLRVLRHRQVPPNDGGISLGQAAVAAATVAR